MGILDFLTGSPEDSAAREQREARQRASEDSVKRGGLPLNATERLSEQARRQGTAQHFFTSDLNVNELSLAHQVGYEPLGQVMGSSIYHIGWQWQTLGWQNSSWYNGVSSELAVLTAAFQNARQLALGRLRQEAALLGASGVIGVRLEHKEQEWGADLLEFMAIGTAIRESGAAFSTQPPFLSDLSGDDFWRLRRGGFRPVGIAVGNCSYYQIPTWSTQNVTQGGWFGTGSWQNVELPDYTQALYSARELAMGRMENDAQSVGASGIVGVSVDVEAKPHPVEVNKRERIDMMYHFTAIGTAIAPFSTPTRALETIPVVSMRR